MVYSASSATSVLQGEGYGSTYLIKFVIYGAIGLVAMRVLARDGVAKVHSITAPLLFVSLALVLAVHIPHVGVSVNGARRWIGPSQLQFQPSELLKLALVLYTATLLAKRPGRVNDMRELARPLLYVVAAACLLVVTQPDIGTAMVICFTVGSMLIVAGIPLRSLGMIVVSLLGLVLLYAIAKPYARQRLTSFIDPWAHATTQRLPGGPGPDRDRIGRPFGVGPGQSVQKIFYLPEAQTDSSSRSSPRRSASRACAGSLPLRADRVRRAARGAESEQPLQRAHRRRGDGADRLAGAAQHVRRTRPRPAHRRAAPARLIRVEQHDRHARGDGSAAERRLRSDGPRPVGLQSAFLLRRRPRARTGTIGR